MTKQELDEMFEKEELEHWEQALNDSLACSDRTIWFCNDYYDECVYPEDLDDEDMVRVVPMTPEEVKDWIGERINPIAYDFDELVAQQGWGHIDVARVEPRDTTN